VGNWGRWGDAEVLGEFDHPEPEFHVDGLGFDAPFKARRFRRGARPPRAQSGSPPRQTTGITAHGSSARTEVDAPLRVRTSEGIDLAPRDQQELKRNKFRAPKNVATRHDIAR